MGKAGGHQRREELGRLVQQLPPGKLVLALRYLQWKSGLPVSLFPAALGLGSQDDPVGLVHLAISVADHQLSDAERYLSALASGESVAVSREVLSQLVTDLPRQDIRVALRYLEVALRLPLTPSLRMEASGEYVDYVKRLIADLPDDQVERAERYFWRLHIEGDFVAEIALDEEAQHEESARVPRSLYAAEYQDTSPPVRIPPLFQVLNVLWRVLMGFAPLGALGGLAWAGVIGGSLIQGVVIGAVVGALFGILSTRPGAVPEAQIRLFLFFGFIALMGLIAWGIRALAT